MKYNHIIICLLSAATLASAAPRAAKPMKGPAKPEQIEKAQAALPGKAPAKPSKAPPPLDSIRNSWEYWSCSSS